ncbi:MAG: TetR/AcrR family transcriptional regulator [Acidobacteriota bacterium]|nr:TetR/AcrR family transcriptional regulator [Acidobacteriota bacterium]
MERANATGVRTPGVPGRSGGRAKRGRPAVFSRERLVETLAASLLEDPGATLTIARAAQAAGCSVMSIYRFFTDRDDLAAALIRYIMRESRSRVVPGDPWQARIRAWMLTVHEQSRRYPSVFQLAASGESPAWVTETVFLAAILREAGLSDDQDLADAIYLIATTSLSQAMLRAAHHDSPTPSLYSVVAQLSPEEASEAAALVPYFAAMGDRATDLVISSVLVAVEGIVAGQRVVTERS